MTAMTVIPPGGRSTGGVSLPATELVLLEVRVQEDLVIQAVVLAVVLAQQEHWKQGEC